jgi:hypothetical protein
MTIGIDLGDVWSHYCTPRKKASSSTGPISNHPNRSGTTFDKLLTQVLKRLAAGRRTIRS